MRDPSEVRASRRLLTGLVATALLAVGLVVGGTTVAHAAGPGDFDTDFAANAGSGLNAPTQSIAAQSDGKIVVVGFFTSAGGATANRIARFNADGTPDTDFNANTNGGLNSAGYSVVEQSDGKILVTGDFTTAGGATANRIARFNADGTPDTDFNSVIAANGGLNGTGFAVAEQSDGKIVVSGNFTTAGGDPTSRIAGFYGDGTPDEIFNTNIAANGGLDEYALSLAVQNNGKVVVTGIFTTAGGTAVNYLARFHANGTADNNFNSNIATNGGLNNAGESLAVQTDGRIVVVGDFSSAGGSAVNFFARFNTDGTPDTGFNANIAANGGIGPVGFEVGLQSDGRIVVVGDFTDAAGGTANRVARFNADGTADTGFNANIAANGGLNYDAYAAAVTTDDDTIVGGDFDTAGGTSAYRIARIYGTGTALTPAFATPSSTADGFTVQVSNYDTDYSWDASASSGAATIGGSGLITVTGLSPGESSTVTVTANRTGYAEGTADVEGTATTTAPGAPTGVAGVAGDGQVTVSWTTPTSTGGSAITGYRIQRKAGSGSWSTAVSNTGSTAVSRAVTGLANGTSYTFRVAAINTVGVGSYSSASSSVTPVGTPGKPGKPVVTARSDGKAKVVWTRSAANGAAVTYEVRRSMTKKKAKKGRGKVIARTTGKKWSGSVPGAADGEALFFWIRPRNAVGAGPASEITKAGMK